jgi:hypothetical protein
MIKPFGAAIALSLAFSSPVLAQTLRPLSVQPPVSVQFAFLETDGSVLAQSADTVSWFRYAPDINGNYANGSWTQVASLQSGYGPTYYASAMLADGRLAMIGGEYNNPSNGYQLQLSNQGAVYDPKANTWTPLRHPKGWKYIGDSESAVLPSGQFLVGQKLKEADAYLDPTTLQWTIVGSAGKSDYNSEEGWTLLADGSVLTADVKNAPNSERYLPAMGKWVSAGSTIVDLHSPTTIQGCLTYGPSKCYYPPGEIGPLMLRPDGTVLATGSASANNSGPGHTAIYHSTGAKAGTWTVGPDFPNGDNAGDSFAVLLPSGNVLVFGVSGTLYEFDYKTDTFIAKGGASGLPLLLPTGQVMMLGGGVSLYTPSGTPEPRWAPHITTAPTTVSRGQTYKISGTQFNGLSMAMAFGDEDQNATNYPLVRITNKKTRHVFYARTHDHSSMGVATGSTPVFTFFDVPARMDTGASKLEVVANGIGSVPVAITVQ